MTLCTSLPLETWSMLTGLEMQKGLLDYFLWLPDHFNAKTLGLGAISLTLAVILINALRQTIVPQPISNPPVVFHWIPWFGSAAGYGDDPVAFFARCREKYGDMFTFVLFGQKITVALSSKGNNFVLGGQSRIFNAEDAYTHLTTPVFGSDVIYDVPNEVFMQQKKFIKVGLSVENFRAYVGMIDDEVQSYLRSDSKFSVFQQNKPDAWGSFSATKVLSEITILTASRTLQGKEVRAGLDKTFAQLYTDLDGGFTPLNFLFPNLPLPSYWRRDRAQRKMTQFYLDIIQKRRSGQSSDHDYDVLDSLMEQKYRNGQPLPDHEVAHLMIALLMAGQHTSSASSAWALLHIASRPDIQKALYDEQIKFFGSPDGRLRDITYEELRQLPLLDNVIRETLRLHPPIHSMLRGVRDDVPVPRTLAYPRKGGGEDSIFIIPKGHCVLASPLMSQIDPSVWQNADTWDPMRWQDPDGIAAAAGRSYFDDNGEKVDFGFGAVSKGTDSPYQPFGAGRHRCIGEQFAYLQLGTILSTFVRLCEFRIPKVPGPNYHTMITMPKAPDVIEYRRRSVD